MVSDRIKKRQAEREAAWRKKTVTRDDLVPMLSRYHDEYVAPLMYLAYTPWWKRLWHRVMDRYLRVRLWWRRKTGYVAQ